MLLNGVPIPMMQPFRFVSCFDCHDVGYKEASSSSSLICLNVCYRGRGEAPVAIVRHRDSHRNLAWRPIPQPRHTGSTREGQIVVRCRKKHKGKEKVVRARGERPHRARTALCTAHTARAPFSDQIFVPNGLLGYPSSHRSILGNSIAKNLQSCT